ncbi:hypothetical protein SSIL_1450 [Solibacillus silvestris StLB046]|uniref:Uncharacterized protein n=1 Tax=Solibacillus silvestris (strain StLB046) TaxID=1002809 RepID=F2F2N5_SOLSS|nr:hypothetical protein [Solibacillus silvestris]BAK15873.1 hypothetical protein SSIL_1450 [Solibacillus silvestris StLB046]
MKKLLWIGALSVLLLTACGDETKEEPKFEETADTTINDSESVEEKKAWNESLEEIINSSESPSEKFYSLETVMMDAEISEDDVNTFKQDILSAYKDKTYLSNPTDDEFMLNLIFKSYIVEQNVEGDWKDFAFDFHQNVKYVYRGAETPESDSVKSNEEQMDKVINKLN